MIYDLYIIARLTIDKLDKFYLLLNNFQYIIYGINGCKVNKYTLTRKLILDNMKDI